MKPGIRFLLAFLLLFPTLAWTQERGQSVRAAGTIVVRVTTDRAGEVPGRIRIELYRHGILWKEARQGILGQHTFMGLPEGNYDVVVSLAHFETRRRTVYVEGNFAQEVVVRLPVRSTGRKPNWPLGGNRATVSARELTVPGKARKAFEKAYRRYRKQDLRGAIKYQLRGLKVDPTFAPAHNQLGLYYLRLGELEKAQESLETALQFDQNLLLAHLNLGDVLVQKQEFEQARQLLLQVSRRYPDRGEPHYVVAKIHYLNGHLERAERELKFALEREHKLSPEAHLVLAGIYDRRGEKDKIPQHLEKYLAEAPEGRFAHQARTMLEKLMREQAKSPPS
jgi:tetratricopeptide (TPR) repeat protein